VYKDSDSLIKAIKIFFGPGSILYWESERFVVCWPVSVNEVEEKVFSSPQACFDHIVSEREKLGMVLFLCKRDPGNYRYNIPALDSAMLRGFYRGPEEEERIKKQDAADQAMRTRKSRIIEAVLVSAVATIAFILIGAEQLINDGTSITTLVWQILMFSGLASSICFITFALWRNYQDKQRLARDDYQLPA